ncbi:MAG: hypothetical protein FRX49_01534 [Trebouxia sp. A1-2]|nr:MAG: hypothetical protein FRX49_01534 [Trebouxia sp. A1-2]
MSFLMIATRSLSPAEDPVEIYQAHIMTEQECRKAAAAAAPVCHVHALPSHASRLTVPVILHAVHY